MTQRVRFMNNNFMQQQQTYSSQQSTFPASYAYNTSRSKLWKPQGNFEVTASNNQIYINDGSDKTISLTAGSYIPSTLASHIQTQLNASSSNWTCTYSTSTYKFTINRTSGTATLREGVTTNAAWDMLGYTQGVTVSTAPFVADEQRNHTSEWIQCDLGVPQIATFIGILGQIDTQFSLSTNATIKLQANNIDDWTSPPIDLTVDQYEFLDTLITDPYRYYRVVIIDRQNVLGPTGISFSYIYVGDDFQLTQSNIATGFTKTLVDPTNVQQSETGALFFEERPRYLTISGASVQLLNGTEFDEMEQLLYDLGIRTPFFVSIDPGLAVSRDLQDLTRFVVLTQSPTLNHIIRDYYTINFEMRESF